MRFFRSYTFSKMLLLGRATPLSIARKLLWFAITILTPLWSQLALGSALSDLATSMQPGTWAQLTTTGFSNGAVLRPPSTGSTLEYTDEGHWNPVNNTVMILGTSHPSRKPPGETQSQLFAKYTESSNTWSQLTIPWPTFDTGQAHEYNHAALNPSTGDFYHRQYYSAKVIKFSHATQSWSQCTPWGNGTFQVGGALEYFPDRNSLVFLDGDWGVWELSLGSGNCTGKWVQRASTNGKGISPKLTGLFGYHNQSRYSSRCQCIIMGGGNGSRKLYRYNADGTFAAIADAPVPIAIPQGGSGTIFTVDPASGLILVWNHSDASTTMYEYDPVTNAWTTISRTSPIFPGPEGGVTATIAVPIANYGAIMFVQAGSSSGGRIYLYRHAAGSRSTPPRSPIVAPSIPSSVSAIAVSSSQINVFWTASTDNVAVQGYRVYRNGGQVATVSTTAYSDTNLSAATSYTYTVAAYDAAGNTSGQSAPSSATTQSAVSSPPPSESSDFETRCSQPGVLKCVSFDSSTQIAWTYGSVSGVFAGTSSNPTIDTSEKASGNGSLKFTIPSNSGANAGGSYFTNFSDDFSVQFDGNSEFYFQWRQRFSPEMLQTFFASGSAITAWKQIIVGTGDKPGCNPSTSASGKCYGSCTALETVMVNYYSHDFPIMYNSCTGSTSHGPYVPFEERYGAYDFKLQNARPSPYCLYSQGKTSPTTFFSPAGNCVGYVANEWMTFQVRIQTGPRVKDEFANSYVQVWMAREGQPSQLVINWGPYNLTAGSLETNQKFGKIWLLPYMTGKDSSRVHPTAYTWYDELIISRNKIADPSSDGGTVMLQAPAAPNSLRLR
jgi:chitodextrinase